MREPAGPTTYGTIRIGFEQRSGDLVDPVTEAIELLGVERVGHGDEAVSVKDRGGSIDVARFDHLQAGEAVAVLQSGSERGDIGIVSLLAAIWQG